MFQRQARFAPPPCRSTARLRARSLVQVVWPSRGLWLDGASAPSSRGHRGFDTGTFRARRLDLAWWSAIHLTQHSSMARDSLEGCTNLALREGELAPRPPIRRLLSIGAKKAPAAGGCCRGRGGAGGGLPAPVHGRGRPWRCANRALMRSHERQPPAWRRLTRLSPSCWRRWCWDRWLTSDRRAGRSDAESRISRAAGAPAKRSAGWPPSGRSGVESFTRAWRATGVDPASSGLQNDPLDDTAVAPPG